MYKTGQSFNTYDNTPVFVCSPYKLQEGSMCKTVKGENFMDIVKDVCRTNAQCRFTNPKDELKGSSPNAVVNFNSGLVDLEKEPIFGCSYISNQTYDCAGGKCVPNQQGTTGYWNSLSDCQEYGFTTTKPKKCRCPNSAGNYTDAYGTKLSADECPYTKKYDKGGDPTCYSGTSGVNKSSNTYGDGCQQGDACVKCLNCDPGYYGTGSCTICPVGYYCTGGSNSNKTKCLPGYTTKSTGSTEESDCLCNPGSVMGSDGSCEQCKSREWTGNNIIHKNPGECFSTEVPGLPCPDAEPKFSCQSSTDSTGEPIACGYISHEDDNYYCCNNGFTGIYLDNWCKQQEGAPCKHDEQCSSGNCSSDKCSS
jgi:hypothetical protein